MNDMSKKLDILNCQGARVGEYVLPDEIIELEKGEQAVHDVIVAFMAGQPVLLQLKPADSFPAAALNLSVRKDSAAHAPVPAVPQYGSAAVPSSDRNPAISARKSIRKWLSSLSAALSVNAWSTAA